MLTSAVLQVVRDTLASLQKSFHQLSQAVNTHIDQEQPASRETEPDADISQVSQKGSFT